MFALPNTRQVKLAIMYVNSYMLQLTDLKMITSIVTSVSVVGWVYLSLSFQ